MIMNTINPRYRAFRTSADKFCSEVLVRSASIAFVFFTCSAVLFGRGIVSHYVFGPSSILGGLAGVVLGIVQSRRTLGAVASGIVCGVGTAFMLAVFYASRVNLKSEFHDGEYWRYVTLYTLCHAIAGIFAGMFASVVMTEIGQLKHNESATRR